MPLDRNPIDVHVGRRIREGRDLRGLSQTRLGEAIRVSFQQVQKYERGTNRASASALFGISLALGVPVSYFFEGLDAQAIDPADAVELELAKSDPKLVREIASLSLQDRGTVCRLVEALADTAATKAEYAARISAMTEMERADPQLRAKDAALAEMIEVYREGCEDGDEPEVIKRAAKALGRADRVPRKKPAGRHEQRAAA